LSTQHDDRNVRGRLLDFLYALLAGCIGQVQVEEDDVEGSLLQGRTGIRDGFDPRYVDWPAVLAQQALPEKLGVVRIVLDQ
jgi:hypothetical protein